MAGRSRGSGNEGRRRDGGGSARDWILVGMDFSAAARCALLRAVGLAHRNGAELVVLHVIEDHGLAEIAACAGISEPDLRERLERERHTRLREVLDEAFTDTVAIPFRILVTWGRPFQEILRKASEFAVDLIVLGHAGRSADLEHALFGSTAERVVRAATCPVLCVPV